MVQGLGFLSKKSWHTKNIANQEKVWIAEQREQAEKQKTAELAKQIQQEKEEEELAKIAGTTKKLDRGINWMYDGHHANSETAKEDAAKQAEEYLLGKEFHGPSGKVAGDLDAGEVHEGVNAVVNQATAGGAAAEEDAKLPPEELEHRRKNEAFRMRHEDPMFAVSLQAVRKEKELDHRKELYERAGIAVKEVARGGDEKQKKKKKHKKDHKKSKKRKKHHKRHHYSSSDDGSYEGRRSRKRSKHHDHTRRRRSRSRSRDSYSSYSSRSHDRDRYDRSYSPDRYDEYDRRQQYSRRRRSPSRSEDSHSRSRDDNRKLLPTDRNDSSKRRHDNRKPPPDSYYDNREQKLRHHSPPQQYNSDHHQKRRERREECYGLQGTNSNTARSGGDLGPDRELLERKRQERESERRRLQESKHSRRYKTAAEREAALREYQQDAARHSATRDRHTQQCNKDDHEDGNQKRNASFLQEMNQKAHGIREDQSMSERLRQNRNTNQRLHDKFL